MPARGAAGRVPRHLGVEVAVDIHESGGDQPPLGVDGTGGGGTGEVPDLYHAVPEDADIGPSTRCPRTVHHRAALDDDVISAHGPLP